MASATSQSHAITSPALSTASVSSYDMLSSSFVSNTSRITADTDSDDEIVWSVSEGSQSPGSSEYEDATESDGDFVLLTRPPSPVPLFTGLSTPVEDRDTKVDRSLAPKSLEDKMAKLSLSPKPTPRTSKKSKKTKLSADGQKSVPSKKKEKKKKKTRAVANPYPSPAASPKVLKSKKSLAVASTPNPASIASLKATQREETAVVKHLGLGERPIVDDVSDCHSVVSCDESVTGPSLYEEAASFISSFLSNPDAKHDTVCRLTLLQSLIIELGLATSSLHLPGSLNAARAVLKSRAFLNIREYMAVRSQGPEAVRRAMYPSKTALIKSIKKKHNRAPLKWVKDHGLQPHLTLEADMRKGTDIVPADRQLPLDELARKVKIMICNAPCILV
ncbi:hypothetical protein NLJ89_g8162 [Agrocybe chaxingu]|uniref:Uncharacterized protein n=1 Tax=Agrocybe chaxingu TaxID=84603 RepID=A0A9W8JVR5_9AGAR|nr:hypothetical protein NLJ89_g8162 [Agrocybe chaxingu]